MPDFDNERQEMVAHLRARGVEDQRVLWAMGQVPREKFIAPEKAHLAYRDGPVAIERGQTISQPYMVAEMLEALWLSPDDKVLEVGAGSGYAAALLSLLAGEVYALERIKLLADTARERLSHLGFKVEVIHADGTLGWPQAAPYDAILVSAGAPKLPSSLCRQLAPGGRLVVPVGPETQQELYRLVREEQGLTREKLANVRFVPLIGADGWG